MPHALRVALLVCLALPAPAVAVTFGFSGSVDTVTDPNGFLDDSVDAGTPVTGTYVVDLTTADTSSPFDVGAAQLSFGLGIYPFDASHDPHSISLIDDTGPPGFPIDIWQSAGFVVSDLNPATNPGGDFSGYSVRIEFFDGTGTIFDGSESAPFVPSSVAGWTPPVRLLIDSLGLGGVPDGRIQVQVNLTNWFVVPEPSSAALLALGLSSIAARRRRTRVR